MPCEYCGYHGHYGHSYGSCDREAENRRKEKDTKDSKAMSEEGKKHIAKLIKREAEIRKEINRLEAEQEAISQELYITYGAATLGSRTWFALRDGYGDAIECNGGKAEFRKQSGR